MVSEWLIVGKIDWISLGWIHHLVRRLGLTLLEANAMRAVEVALRHEVVFTGDLVKNDAEGIEFVPFDAVSVEDVVHEVHGR